MTIIFLIKCINEYLRANVRNVLETLLLGLVIIILRKSKISSFSSIFFSPNYQFPLFVNKNISHARPTIGTKQNIFSHSTQYLCVAVCIFTISSGYSGLEKKIEFNQRQKHRQLSHLNHGQKHRKLLKLNLGQKHKQFSQLYHEKTHRQFHNLIMPETQIVVTTYSWTETHIVVTT